MGTTSTSVVVVTGNENKLREILAIAPKTLDITAQRVELDEIQSLDLHDIVSHKLKQAYERVHEPVIVEDVSAELDNLGGLPGPFVKFFIEKMGRSALHQLSQVGAVPDTAQSDDTQTGVDTAAEAAISDGVTIRCLAGYFDGATMLFGEGVVRGHVTAPRGTHGFGFDSTVVPQGEARTVAEMSADEKNRISHRAQAMRNLFAAIATHTKSA